MHYIIKTETGFINTISLNINIKKILNNKKYTKTKFKKNPL